MDQHEAVLKYGTPDRNGRLGLYYGITKTPNNAGLYMVLDDEFLSMKHKSCFLSCGRLVAQWKLDNIVTDFNKKVQDVLLVKAQAKKVKGTEYFKYNTARLLTGGVSKENIKAHFEDDILVLELRLHKKNGSVKNHGSAIRIKKKNIDVIYTKNQEISF
jgi:hypothetical protein